MSSKVDSLVRASYLKHDFNLTDGQIKMIVEAVKSKTPIKFKLKKETFTNGTMSLPLTKTEANHVKNNMNFNYSLNKTKLAMLKTEERTGGFFPLLIPILAGISALGAVAGGASGIAKAVLDKQNNDSKLGEEKRYHDELLKVAGKTEGGSGDGLFLTPWKNGMSVGVKDFVNNSKLEPIAKKALRNILKNLSDHFLVERQGDGLYLSPRV